METKKQAALHNITVLAKCRNTLTEEIVECATPPESAVYTALDEAFVRAIVMEAEKLKPTVLTRSSPMSSQAPQ